MRLTLSFFLLAFLGFPSPSPSPSSSVSIFLVARFFNFPSSSSSFLTVGGMSSSAT